MRTTERLTKLRDWLYEELCQGRTLKSPAANRKVADATLEEPKVFLAWFPTRSDQTQLAEMDGTLCPGVLVMPNASKGKSAETKSLDRYNDVNRSKVLGQTLSVSLLFCVYEPGARQEGFQDNKGDITLLSEGTEQGLFTLLNWLDDCVELLLSKKLVPGTDLMLNEESVVYSLYTDQSFVVDKRPFYYGFVNAEYYCHADTKPNPDIDEKLT